MSDVRKSYERPASIYGAAAPREKIYISCWHQQTHELAAMWSSYAGSGDAIAIRSTLSALTECLDEDYTIGSLQYINYSKTLPAGAAGRINRYFFKRQSFKAEQEIRAVFFRDIGRDRPAHFRTIDINVLIQKIYVAPKSKDWFRDVVTAVSQRYGVAAPVRRSSLDKDPIF